MNNGIKWLIVGGVGAFILLASGFLIGHDKLKKKAATQASIIEEQQSQITYHKNGRDQEYAKRVAAEGDLKTLKTAYGEEIKEIRKSLDINSRAIKAITRVSTVSTGSGIGTIDTIYIKDEKNLGLGKQPYSIAVSDTTRWFDINGVISNAGFRYLYQARDSITLVPYKDGKRTYVKGISSNPNTKLSGLQAVLISTEPRTKRFGIGPSVQVNYTDKINFTFGISIQWNVIRF